MVGHGGSSASSYLADPTSPIPSHCASIVATSTLRVTSDSFFIAWGTGQGLYKHLTVVDAGGTQNLRHPLVSRLLYRSTIDPLGNASL